MKPGRSRGWRRPHHEYPQAGEGTLASWPILPVRHGITPLVLSSDRTYATPRHTVAVHVRNCSDARSKGTDAREYAALHAGVQYWCDQIEALRRPADVQSDVAVNPR
jgi:hypothetical protein